MVYMGAVMLNSSEFASLRMFKIVFSTIPSTRLPNSAKLQNSTQKINNYAHYNNIYYRKFLSLTLHWLYVISKYNNGHHLIM